MKFLVAAAAALMLTAWVAKAEAATIVLTPTTTGVFGINFGPANCEVGCVYTAFGLTNDGSLGLLYKHNVGGSESGSFADNYNTTGTVADMYINWDGGSEPFITCPNCYLAIKDGNHDPSYYFYNLLAWDGKDTIRLSGFWPEQGAISHVSIWGNISGDPCTPETCPEIPEPASLLLLGAGLAAIAAGLRRRKTA